MKRKNPKTNELFKYGDVRADGKVFRTYLKAINKDGFNKEVWLSQSVFISQHSAQKKASASFAKRRRELVSKLFRRYKLAVGCSICGYKNHHVALDFDHIDPSEKLFNLSCSHSMSMELIRSEIRKCRVLCSNCHRVETFNNKHYEGRSEAKKDSNREAIIMKLSSIPNDDGVMINNTSGVTGVYYNKSNKEWVARVTVSGARKEIYRNKDKFEVICAIKSFNLNRSNQSDLL